MGLKETYKKVCLFFSTYSVNGTKHGINKLKPNLLFRFLNYQMNAPIVESCVCKLRYF